MITRDNDDLMKNHYSVNTIQLHILSKHKLFKYAINWSELHPELEYFTQEEKSAYIIYLDTVIHLFNTQEINPYLAVEDCYSGL